MKNEKIGIIILTILGIVSLIGIFFIPPIPQNQAYHNFVDDRTILGIPNFWNVISNLPFLVVGIWGLLKVNAFAKKYLQYTIFFFGVAIVSFGSAYYHWTPNDSTLVWDRLPMTIGFMALFSIVVSEYIKDTMGRKLLFPLIVFGLVIHPLLGFLWGS